MLPKEAIAEYQSLYKKHFKRQLTFEEATKRAEDFIQFFRTIHKPIKKEWLKSRKHAVLKSKD